MNYRFASFPSQLCECLDTTDLLFGELVVEKGAEANWIGIIGRSPSLPSRVIRFPRLDVINASISDFFLLARIMLTSLSKIVLL